MSELELKIRLKADGSGLVGELSQGDKAVKALGAELDKTSRQAQSSAKHVKDYAESTKQAAQQSNFLSRTGTALAGKLKTARYATMNLSYQLQDVAVQAAAGTDSLRILGQQGPQIASIFGPGGAVLGVLIAVGSAIAGVASSAGASKSKLRELREEALALGGAFSVSESGLTVYDERIRRINESAPIAAEALFLVRQRHLELESSLLKSAIDERFQSFNALTQEFGITTYNTFLGARTGSHFLNEAIADMAKKFGGSSGDVKGLVSALERFNEEANTNTAGQLIAQLTNLKGSSKETKAQLNEMITSLAKFVEVQNQLGADGAVSDQVLAVNGMVAALKKEADTLGFTDRQRDLYTARLNKATDAQLSAINKAYDAIEARERAEQQQKTNDRLADRLKVIEKGALDQVQLEKRAYAERLATVNKAEKAGVASLVSYQVLRERLARKHGDNLVAIDQQAKAKREREQERKRQATLRQERAAAQQLADRRFAELAIERGYLDRDFDLTQAHYARKEVAERVHQERLQRARLNGLGDYSSLGQQFVNFDKQSGAERVATAVDIATQVSGVAARESKKAFEIHKALSIAQATINAAMAISNVLGEASPIPTAVRVPLAITIGGLAAAQIAMISRQDYQGGRMMGGHVSAGKFVEVGEHNRPELFKQDGKLLLFPGNRGGEVVPLEGRRAKPSQAPATANAQQVVVNLYNAPAGAEVQQRGNEIDIIWPDIQNRLSRDIKQGAPWAQVGEGTYGWNRGNGARAAR